MPNDAEKLILSPSTRPRSSIKVPSDTRVSFSRPSRTGVEFKRPSASSQTLPRRSRGSLSYLTSPTPRKQCLVDDCDDARVSRGYCATHLAALNYESDPNDKGKTPFFLRRRRKASLVWKEHNQPRASYGFGSTAEECGDKETHSVAGLRKPLFSVEPPPQSRPSYSTVGEVTGRNTNALSRQIREGIDVYLKGQYDPTRGVIVGRNRFSSGLLSSIRTALAFGNDFVPMAKAYMRMFMSDWNKAGALISGVPADPPLPFEQPCSVDCITVKATSHGGEYVIVVTSDYPEQEANPAAPGSESDSSLGSQWSDIGRNRSKHRMKARKSVGGVDPDPMLAGEWRENFRVVIKVHHDGLFKPQESEPRLLVHRRLELVELSGTLYDVARVSETVRFIAQRQQAQQAQYLAMRAPSLHPLPPHLSNLPNLSAHLSNSKTLRENFAAQAKAHAQAQAHAHAQAHAQHTASRLRRGVPLASLAAPPPPPPPALSPSSRVSTGQLSMPAGTHTHAPLNFFSSQRRGGEEGGDAGSDSEDGGDSDKGGDGRRHSRGRRGGGGRHSEGGSAETSNSSSTAHPRRYDHDENGVTQAALNGLGTLSMRGGRATGFTSPSTSSKSSSMAASPSLPPSNPPPGPGYYTYVPMQSMQMSTIRGMGMMGLPPPPPGMTMLPPGMMMGGMGMGGMGGGMGGSVLRSVSTPGREGSNPPMHTIRPITLSAPIPPHNMPPPGMLMSMPYMPMGPQQSGGPYNRPYVVSK